MSANICFRAVRPLRVSVCPFIHLSGQILLPRYLMNGLSSLDETYREYSLTHSDDLIGFWRSKVKVTADHRGGEGIQVDAEASKSIHLVAVALGLVGLGLGLGMGCLYHNGREELVQVARTVDTA